MELSWHNETRRLGDLKPQEDNPRQMRAVQAERLNESWDDYGQVDLLAIGPDGDIYNGHQRYYVLLDKHGPDYQVECRVSSRPLERREWQRLTVLLHEGAVGEWDFDGLANWEGVDTSDLLEWGFKPYILGLDAGIDYDGIWQGMPEFEQEDREGRVIKVHFRTEEDVGEFAELVGQKITEKTRAIWYPELERERFSDKRYVERS